MSHEEMSHDTLVDLLAEAKEIVEEGLGSLYSSGARDAVLLHVLNWLFMREREKRHQETPPWPWSPEPSPEPADRIARELLREMVFSHPRRHDRRWVWETYAYFLKQARREQARAKNST